jgi:methionyl-tRNA formyltransferase
MKKKKIKVCFMGGNQAGVIGLLTLLSLKIDILACVYYSEDVKLLCKKLKLQVNSSIKENYYNKCLKKSDILVSVHGREIVTSNLLSLPRLGAINVHPYLYKYKGKDPVKRALKDKNYKASVGVHKMTEKIDEGKVIIEKFINVDNAKSENEIYNILYPYYSVVLIDAIKKIT